MKFSRYLPTAFALLFAFNAAANSQCQVVHNVKGYTPTNESKVLLSFNWVAFKDGKFLATGKDQIHSDYQKCQKLDGKNQYLLPGLIDAHGHVSGLGNEILRVKLRGINSEVEAAKKVADFAKANPNTRWVLGRGWNQVLWMDKEFPTKDSLDKTGIKRPVLLRRIDGHAAWVNSKAMEIAGINKHTKDPAGGKIIRDAHGNPTGVLIDNAIDLVESKIPEPTIFEVEHAYDKAFEHLLSLGIVSAHDAGVGQAGIDFYKRQSKAGTLPMRIYVMLDGAAINLHQWLNQGIYNDDNQFLSIQSVKLYMDGALGSRGAALLEPYSDDSDNKGLLLTQPKKLQSLMFDIIKKGFQVNVHAIGDRGNRIVLDTYEKAFKTVGGQALRHRIEHSQIVDVEDIPRFKSLDIIPSMQPVHATSDKNMAEDRLGAKRLAGAYAWQKFIQQGSRIASGSDFPVELANPFHGLHAAITRQDHQNMPQSGWLPDERMTPAQALISFTLDAAYSAHQEKTMGSIETGKWADFILLDTDVVNGKKEDIWKAQVLQTWIAGELKYQKQ